MGSIVLLDLMGGVALLLWGLHMVRSGIMRAFGSGLRRFLSTALRNRFLALLAGIGVTALLQSSTATGLLMTSFAARGLVELVPGLAVMLGANIGTTLIVQALSFDVAALAPVLFLIGLLAFNFGGRTITRDLGRVAIGLGLMLLSLHILIDTLAPAENAPSVRIVLGAITAEPTRRRRVHWPRLHVRYPGLRRSTWCQYRAAGYNIWLTFALSPAPPSTEKAPPPMLTKSPSRN
jgi:phosphate:Na+ symporter